MELRLLKALEKIPPELRGPLTEVLEIISQEIGERLTKKDFEAFERRFEAFAERTEENFRKLAEAQRRTEERLERFEKQTEENFNRVWQVINELAEAQKRTEERLAQHEDRLSRVEKILEKLAEAQKETEERLTRLEKVVEELAEAQKRTEERLERFEKQTEENFDRVWQAINELTEAQKRTEEEIQRLTQRMDKFERRLELVEDRLEGLSDSIGYSLENMAYRALPKILAERFGLQIEGRLLRRYFKVGRKKIQINVYGWARKNGSRILVLGECKVRPSKKEIERFRKYATKIAHEEGAKEAFVFFLAHDFPPEIEEFLRQKDLPYLWSYELE